MVGPPSSANFVDGVKIFHNKEDHYPFRKSQLDSQTFGQARRGYGLITI